MSLIKGEEYKTANGDKVKLLVHIDTSNLNDIKIKIANLTVTPKGKRKSLEVVEFGRHDSWKTCEQEYEELLKACSVYCTTEEVRRMLDKVCLDYIDSIDLATRRACQTVVEVLEG